MLRHAGLPSLLVIAAFLALPGCVSHQRVVRSSSLEFLYPQGADPVAASDVTLKVPVRVGLAFVPEGAGSAAGFRPLAEDQRQALLERIAAAFRDRDVISSLEVIPSTYLSPSGSFDNLDRLRAAFGIDLILLISYELTQFGESTGRSIAYWTIIGAYVVKGEKNETRTMLEAVVYDIPSRALLFRAGGSSSSQARSTPGRTGRVLLSEASAGFDAAVGELIANLDEALGAFEAQARTGTVRGVGTPAISLVDSAGAPAPSGGAGAFGPWEWIGLAVLAALSAPLARQRRC